MTPTATRPPDDLKEQPWVDVLRTLAEELRDFVQQEIQLVKAELSSKVKHAGTGAGMFGAAGFMGFLAAGALTAAMILALALVVPAWAAALIVAAFYGLTAGGLALSGKKKVHAAMPLAPEQALRAVQAAKEQVQQAWERGSHQAYPTGLPASRAETIEVPTAPAEAAPVESSAGPAGTVPSRTSLPRY